jgi:hypothetical protein
VCAVLCETSKQVVNLRWWTFQNQYPGNIRISDIEVSIARANYCRVLDGKPLDLYGMYTITMNELKTVLKVGAQAG